VLCESFESIGILVNQDLKGRFEGLAWFFFLFALRLIYMLISSRGGLYIKSALSSFPLPQRRSCLGSEPHFKIRFWIHFLIVMTGIILIP
jgi:hypothetical protein